MKWKLTIAMAFAAVITAVVVVYQWPTVSTREEKIATLAKD